MFLQPNCFISLKNKPTATPDEYLPTASFMNGCLLLYFPLELQFRCPSVSQVKDLRTFVQQLAKNRSSIILALCTSSVQPSNISVIDQ